jgi:hypothetical protein
VAEAILYAAASIAPVLVLHRIDNLRSLGKCAAERRVGIGDVDVKMQRCAAERARRGRIAFCPACRREAKSSLLMLVSRANASFFGLLYVLEKSE